MRILPASILAGSLSVSQVVPAQGVFNGTWRPNAETFDPTMMPDAVKLADGIYECETCTPPYKIKADGTDQAISDNPYYDTVSISTIDARTVRKVAKKAGKVVADSTIVVSPDGKTVTEVQTIYDMAPRPIEMTTHSSRVSGSATAAHLVSGAWRMTDSDVSNHAEDTIFKINGKNLEMTDRMGRSFKAGLDGTDAPFNGSDAFTSVSLKVIDGHTIEESDKRDGAVVKISRWTVSADGQTMHVRFDDTHGHVQEQSGHRVK